MRPHLLRLDELPLEGRVGLLGHWLVRVVRGVDEDELVGLEVIEGVGLQELDVFGVDELDPRPDRDKT